jgi:hypothetical protein
VTSDTRALRRRSRRLPGARTAVVTLTIVLAAAVAAVTAAQVAGRHGEPRPAAAGRPVLPARPAALMAAVAAATAAQPAPSSTPTPGITLPGAPAPGPAPTPSPSPSTSGTGGNSSSPGIFDIPGQIQQAIDNWFAGLVKAAINPVLALLGRTVLATPDITGQARITQLWTAMAVLANTLYVLFILAGAVLVTSHETLQTRYSVKEVAPRLVVGMIASNASLAVIGLAISLANALSAAFLGQGVSPGQAGTALGKMVVASIANNSVFLTLMGLGVAVMAVVVLVTYLVRVALMVLITVAAPVALACHALPQTDGLARTWWRALTGCLLIQLGQSLVVIVTVRVFLDPGGTGILGLPTGGGLVDLLVSGTLFYILIKIPFWVRGYILGGGGRGGFAGLVKGLVTYRLARAAMGAFSGGAGSAVAAFGRRPRPGGGARPGPGGRPGGGPGTGGQPRGPGGGRAGRAPAGPAGRGPAGPSAESGARRPVDAAPPLPDGSQARPARHAAPPPLPGGGSGRLARHSKPPPLPADLRPRPPARMTAGPAALPSAQVQPSARHAKPPPLPGGSARHSKPPPLPAAGVQPPRAAAPRGKPVPPAAPPPAGRPSGSPGSPARRTPPAVPPPAVPRRPAPPQPPRPAAARRTTPRRS